MTQSTIPRTTLHDYLRVLQRHRRVSLAFFAVMAILAVVVSLAIPKTFVSEAKLFVRLGRESVSLDPTATTGGQMIPISDSREGEIRSVANLLENRSIFENVVDRLGTEVVLERESAATGPFAWFAERLPSPNATGTHHVREQAIRKLQQSIRLDNPSKSHVIVLSCRARTAERAQQLLQAYIDECLDQYVCIHRNPSSHKFFVEQTELLRHKVLEATRQLRDAKNELGIVSIEGQRRILENQLSGLNQELSRTQAALQETQDRISVLQERVGAIPEGDAASALTTRAIDDMRAQLYRLQLEEQDLLARYTSEHPRVQAIHQQVGKAQQLLDQQELLIERSSAATYASRIRSLRSQHEEIGTRLKALNEKEVQLAELQRRLDQLTASYRTYMTNLEQARIDEALESDRITNISLAQRPTLVARPQSQQRRAALAGGMFLAIFGSAGLAFLRESLSPVPRSQLPNGPVSAHTLLDVPERIRERRVL